MQFTEMGAIQIVAFLLSLWAVRTPPTAVCPGWCPHQPATIIYTIINKMKISTLHNTAFCYAPEQEEFEMHPLKILKNLLAHTINFNKISIDVRLKFEKMINRVHPDGFMK
jgi:hypothetical protein